jgi:hypothetical protein
LLWLDEQVLVQFLIFQFLKKMFAVCLKRVSDCSEIRPQIWKELESWWIENPLVVVDFLHVLEKVVLLEEVDVSL